ncbi:glucose-6-phosphate isomerase [Eionea flava]
MKLSRQAAYKQLSSEHSKVQGLSLRRLFEENNQRAEQFSLELEGIYFDFSKNHLISNTLKQLTQFAHACELPKAIEALFSGECVNNTEARPALHTALRFQGNPSSAEQNAVHATLIKMQSCVDKLHQQQWLGHTHKPINTIVNIGIGGSDLGPRMVTEALSEHKQWLGKVKFVANIDGADLSDTLAEIDPATTLFITASKSFTTTETLTNTLSAKQWIVDSGCSDTALAQHFIAITANTAAAIDMGLSEENIFNMWDWVGGRYSLWSAIGLPIAISIGMDKFRELLAGAHAMDEHYRQAPIEKNMPAVAALCGFWYSQFWDSQSYAILPYAQRLARLPAFLQQLDMESLGKSTSRNGEPLTYSTGSIVWGTEGSNGQHSYHQLLHQGQHTIPVDFILVKQSMSPHDKQHQQLLACGISQSQALLQGKTLTDAKRELRQQGLEEEGINRLAPHKVVAGNKPSNTLILEALTPYNLGSLLAFYEHKVHAQSILLNINAFDQWGVELGKQLAKPIAHALETGLSDETWDSSTQQLINKLK